MAFNGQEATKGRYRSALAAPQNMAIRQGVMSGLTLGVLMGERRALLCLTRAATAPCKVWHGCHAYCGSCLHVALVRRCLNRCCWCAGVMYGTYALALWVCANAAAQSPGCLSQAASACLPAQCLLGVPLVFPSR